SRAAASKAHGRRPCVRVFGVLASSYFESARAAAMCSFFWCPREQLLRKRTGSGHVFVFLVSSRAAASKAHGQRPCVRVFGVLASSCFEGARAAAMCSCFWCPREQLLRRRTGSGHV